MHCIACGIKSFQIGISHLRNLHYCRAKFSSRQTLQLWAIIWSKSSAKQRKVANKISDSLFNYIVCLLYMANECEAKNMASIIPQYRRNQPTNQYTHSCKRSQLKHRQLKSCERRGEHLACIRTHTRIHAHTNPIQSNRIEPNRHTTDATSNYCIKFNRTFWIWKYSPKIWLNKSIRPRNNAVAKHLFSSRFHYFRQFSKFGIYLTGFTVYFGWFYSKIQRNTAKQLLCRSYWNNEHITQTQSHWF